MQTTANNLVMKLQAIVRRDPRRSTVLIVLVAVLVAMWGKMLLGSGGKPRTAAASLANSPGVSASPTQSLLNAEIRRSGSIAALRQWLGTPVKPVARNLFTVRLEYFPVDGSKSNNVAGSDDSNFWGRLEKSLSDQADQKNKRENLLTNFKAEAGKLKLDSTMMGPTPKALINGTLVGVGDVVASFRVLKIESRRIVVEREGIRLEILMK